ncbi:MAG TPA: hypothetical protein VF017_16375 [Thermoanaerobaculia bacterium]|nr:hypothetical protein [Thermoanaerobaculia bacterium]
MTKLGTGALLVALLGSASTAAAEIGTIDAVPAATLLLPYFEVNLDDLSGVTTLFSINNARESAALAHVTFWTDLGVATLDFNVYLTGYDVVTFNLRDVFTTGVTPMTASDGQDPADTISPQGPFSVDINFPSCNGQLPLPPLPAALIDHLRAAHTGRASGVFSGLCSGVNHGDNIARGYLTIDNVSTCTLLFPYEPGYFVSGGTGAANNTNQLWGDYFYVDAANNFAQGETLVHIEASNALGAGNYTFYRRFSGGEDQREGLGSSFAMRYLNGGVFDGGTDLLVWRDPKRTILPFSCALPYPSPFPLGETEIVVFDEQENADVPEPCPISPGCGPAEEASPDKVAQAKIPFAANRVAVSSPSFLTSAPGLGLRDLIAAFNFGWLRLNLNTTVAGSQVPFEPITQNWVAAVMDANGRFSVGFDAIQLDNVTYPGEASNQLIVECDGPPDPVACD